MLRTLGAVLVVGLLLGIGPAVRAAGVGGTLTVEVVDRETKRPLACRMHLKNAAGKTLKAPRVPFWYDHFAFDGQVSLKLPKGEYEFVIERGLEYLTQTGKFTLDNFSKDTKVVELERFANLAAEGWWSGDLDTARFAGDLELLMKADDLHVVELISWPGREVLLPKQPLAKGPLVAFDQDRFFHQSAGIDARGGGTLLFFNLQQPLDLGDAAAEFPPQQHSIDQAKRQTGAWVDVQKAYGWDVPVWVSSGEVDSIQLLNSNLRRASPLEQERGGRPRDTLLFPGVSGNARWSEAIYFHLLNCGLRIPPSAGSGSGEFGNPLGYNRMYVQVDGPLTYEKWWEGVRAGRVVVTNGPLLRPSVEGEPPGHVFRAEAGENVELEIGLTLSTRDPIEYVEVIKDGTLAAQVRVEDLIEAGGRLPAVVFDRSGWLVVRAEASVPNNYRVALSAPYYVEIGGEPRISKKSAEFFVDWVKRRGSKLKIADPQQKAEVIELHKQALKYWQALLARANAP